MAARTFPEMPTPSSLLSAYASMSTSIMLFRTMFNQLFPRELRRYVLNAVRFYWKPKSSKLTLVFDEKDGLTANHMFEAAEAFLCTRINPDSERLRITKSVKENHINVKFADSETIADSFEGIQVSWTYVRQQPQQRPGGDGDTLDYASGNSSSGRGGFSPERKYIELKFDKKHRETIISSYLPLILQRSEQLQNQKKIVKLHNLQSYGGGPGHKESVNLDHPSTFDTLAMDPGMKKAIIDDLNLFLKRKEFYKRVGKAWKRGYLLYGPPGTGKSSLIAAMANYLNFDIYDLELTDIRSNSELRRLLVATANRSILVVEDIDCSMELHDRADVDAVKALVNLRRGPRGYRDEQRVTLSGFLNFIDGLWSSCGDERIIIFTTNRKDKLDPALLRPGRMDVHINMSYCTPCGFRLLASNYLGITEHDQFEQIEDLLGKVEITPAEVAEQLLKDTDPDIALGELIEFFDVKKKENEEAKAKAKAKEQEELAAKEREEKEQTKNKESVPQPIEIMTF